MKKTLITFLILTLASAPVFAAQQVEELYDDLSNIDQKFFESAVLPEAKVKVEQKQSEPSARSSSKNDSDHMPFFKQTRVRIQRALRKHDRRLEEKRIQKEKERALLQKNDDSDIDTRAIKYLETEDSMKTDIEGELESEFIDDQGELRTEEDLQDSEKKSAEEQNKEDNAKVLKSPEGDVALVGGVKEQVTENEMVLDCDNVVMDEETGEIEAIGNPVLIFPAQNIKLTADHMSYNKDSNIMKAFGNVVLTKDGNPVYGDYIQINMNEENIFMDNITAAPPAMKIKAKKAVSDNGKLILHDGMMYSENSNEFRFITRMIGPDFTRMIIDEKDENRILSGEHGKLRVVASDIDVNALKDHDTVQFKDVEIYYNDKHLFNLPSFTAHTNKEQEYVEANYPELGSQARFGMFAGPGFVFDAPFGSVVKLIPLINYKDKFGIGGAIKYRSAFNETNFMYGSGADIFVLRGKQQLDDNLFLQYGSNAYMDDWFLGRRMPKYLAELVYDKGTTIHDFLAEGKDLTFRHRASTAFAQDGEWNMHSENIRSTGISTTRFRYMAEINQSLYKYLDEENRKSFELGIAMQGSAAVYGTGDTQFVGRIGPRIHTQYKYWMQDIGYFLSAYSDNTPMPVYDMYRYGRSNFYIREALRLNKYLTVGWAGSVTLSGDSPNGELFQENAFIVSLGPDDFKVNLGYDFMRKTTYFTVAMLIDTKGTTVEFDKMEIKNPERLGKSDRKKENDDVAFKQSAVSPVAPKLQYAEVIDIEDPNKESI